MAILHPLDYYFKNSPYWIGFALSPMESTQYDNENDFFTIAKDRATKIFHSLIEKEDNLILIIRQSKCIDDSKEYHSPKIKRYLRNKHRLYSLKFEIFPDPDDEELFIHQHSLKIQAKDLRTPYFIESCINIDFLKKPFRIGHFYILNQSKNLIFNLYDDRGVNVCSFEKETLYPIYKRFRSWISDYRRIEIDTIFEDGLYQTRETEEETEKRVQENGEKVKETGINLYYTNTCEVSHTLEIPIDLMNDCIEEMKQTGFVITNDSQFITATKIEALGLIDYQSELMSLYAKKYKGMYKGWTAKRMF